MLFITSMKVDFPKYMLHNGLSNWLSKSLAHDEENVWREVPTLFNSPFNFKAIIMTTIRLTIVVVLRKKNIYSSSILLTNTHFTHCANL